MSLVLVNCSKSKAINPLKLPEIMRGIIDVPSDDIDKEEHYRSMLSQYLTRAEQLYRGPEFTAYKSLANRYGASLLILSARYGLIRGSREILPYDATLAGKGRDYIEETVNKWIAYGNYDAEMLRMRWRCAVIRLSRNYLLSLRLIGERLGFNPCTVGEKTIMIGPKTELDSLGGECFKVYIKGNGEARKAARLIDINECSLQSPPS